jgi:adenine-specific DNA-methyltransferase
MPTLHWIGKEKVINHHLDVPYRVLDHQYTFSSQKAEALEVPAATNLKAEALEAETTGNKIIHGDNLEALKSLLPEYEGKIKCIYIDPPYNTGKEGWVYNDNVNDPKIKKWLGQVVGKEAEDLTRHDKWLCMMYPRLKLLNKLLSEEGTIIISIDDKEYASLKIIMDEIFGADNILIQGIINKASEIASAYTISKHEYYLIYCKSLENFSIDGSSKYTISRGTVGNENQTMPTIEFPKGLNVLNLKDGVYNESRKIIGSSENIENLDPFIVKEGKLQENVRLKAKWRSSNDMRNFFANNCNPTKAKINGIIEEIYFEGDRLMPYIKKKTSEKITSMYLNNKRGSIDLENLGMKGTFENPKSLVFLEDFLDIVTDSNSIILDSFAGSGTTAHAVLNLNKQDGGNRKFICIEMEDYAETITAERVKRVINGFGDKEGKGGSFDYYELGPALFNDDNEINELVGVEKLRQYIYYTETKGTLTSLSSAASVMTSSASVMTSRASVIEAKKDNEYLLNKHNDTAYYFYYEQDGVTTLNHDFLSTIKTRAEQYVIYADNCLLTKEFMTKHHIIFKKIPRDITKF